jgi:hypothetical protein
MLGGRGVAMCERLEDTIKMILKCYKFITFPHMGVQLLFTCVFDHLSPKYANI